MKTVRGIGDCYEKLVKEFLVNIPEDCDNPVSPEYQKVFVRGECVNFSPAIINKFLERNEEPQPELEVSDNAVCKEITAGQVKVGPKKGKISSRKLSVKYAILNRIGAANWGPYQAHIKHCYSSIILEQHPGIRTASDIPKKREYPLTLHNKLFGEHHVIDIVGTSSKSVPAPAPMSRKDVIADLKAHCLELDEKKLQFERMIQALELEEVAEGEPVGSKEEEEENDDADQEDNTDS
ncbi:envelope-like protein, partial [Trifolium medium]|nr:envelope-like protein [Trifolium medium]